MPHRLLTMKLGLKLPMPVLGAAAISALGVGVTGYQTAARIVHEYISSETRSIVKLQHARLQDYLASIESDLKVMGADTGVIDATRAFTAAGADRTATVENPTDHL